MNWIAPLVALSVLIVTAVLIMHFRPEERRWRREAPQRAEKRAQEPAEPKVYGRLEDDPADIHAPDDLDLTIHAKDRPRVVFTTSSIPSRVDNLVKLVHNLMTQTVKADAVHINLPYYSLREKKPYTVPESLARLAEHDYRGRLFINRCEDTGPITKLLPCLRMEPDPSTIILPVDDDVGPPPRYFEELVYFSIKYPGTAFGYHALMFDRETMQPVVVFERTEAVDVVETVTGAAYRRAMFDDRVFDVSKRDPYFTTDDIWINANVAQNGFNRMLLKSGQDAIELRGRKGMRMTHEYDAPNPLYKINGGGGGDYNARSARLLEDVFVENPSGMLQ